MPDEEDALAFYKEAIGTTHKIVSIDKDGDYRLPLVFNTDDDETSFWKADELELVKSAKAPTPPRFILQYNSTPTRSSYSQRKRRCERALPSLRQIRSSNETASVSLKSRRCGQSKLGVKISISK